MPDSHGAQEAGVPMYTNGFLPSIYQPTMFRPGAKPVLNLDLPKGVTLEERRRSIALLKESERSRLCPRRTPNSPHASSAYDTAFKMQTEAPKVFDLTNEPQETLEMYGVGDPKTDDYGRRCLMARRMVENGVRFVCVVSGGGGPEAEWDAHATSKRITAAWRAGPTSLSPHSSRTLNAAVCSIRPSSYGAANSAAPPNPKKSNGRDHHNTGFSMWVAGGGFRGGTIYGATDAIGLKAIEKPVHFRDLHTTMLYQMGLSQDALSYMHLGRNERLTEVRGEIVKDIIL